MSTQPDPPFHSPSAPPDLTSALPIDLQVCGLSLLKQLDRVHLLSSQPAHGSDLDTHWEAYEGGRVWLKVLGASGNLYVEMTDLAEKLRS